MSSRMRGSTGTIRDAYRNGIVRRMVSLPRSIFGGFSRVMGRGRIGFGGRNQNLSSYFQLHPPQDPFTTPEEWSFLVSFEQQYGSTHPFFYACQFTDALKMAEDEHKFMFMYLHSPDHPFTPSFCNETLCSELVVQFLDANFVSWGALADRGEGLQMVAALQATTFPYCAVVAPAAGDSIAVLQQTEGPISSAQLVEILQRTVEEQGLAFGKPRVEDDEKMKAKVKEEEKIRADRQLREEQDAAYFEALKIDKEKERLKNMPSEKKVQKPVETSSKTSYEKLRHSNVTEKQYAKGKGVSTAREAQNKDFGNRSKDNQITQIMIRFPNGERKEQSFSCSDKIRAIYIYIDSLGLPGIVNYRLISSFPRRVYGVDQMGMTLKEAGFHPKATLFLELL
ncbi:hypothetical protein K2173_022783 [Erythroxylum novogranatense]|uniref:UBX domain-containing protein n=1 Tax=Erythroxylum novogranatense TaxID=1862640 RepID=A0AAV8SMN2_9ROSI|nr:hypothetical protein K2173_022783 [Erythroxylum novogranatense]